MDVLSDVLSVCRSEHAVSARFALTAPWGLQSSGVPGSLIRMARGAPFWMQVKGGEPFRVAAGDLVMLPLGAPHILCSKPGVAAEPFANLIARHRVGAPDENPLVFAHGGGGALTDMFTTQVWFSAYCRHSVLSILPPVIHIRHRDLDVANGLAITMESLVVETLAQRPGWRLSTARLGELLLVNIVREHLEVTGTSALGAGWLRGLSDAGIARAIMNMHQQPGQGWTVESLAREAGMSRTRFASSFKELVGVTPIHYLTSHRMALVAEQLEGGRQSQAQIAQDVGYESDKVLARAFRRWSGVTPSAYVRREKCRRPGTTAYEIAEQALSGTGSKIEG
jgi:AraC-like DNA-binding protein